MTARTHLPASFSIARNRKRMLALTAWSLAALMGHRAATICTIIAQRIAQNVDTDYKPFVRKMISTALDKLAVLK